MKKSGLLDIQMMNSELARILKNKMNHQQRIRVLKDYFSDFDTRWLIIFYEYYLENKDKLVSDFFKDSIFSKDMLNLRHSENTMKDILKVLDYLIGRRAENTIAYNSNYETNKNLYKENENEM